MKNEIKIICEIASAHEGDLNKLKDLIDVGLNSKSDFVKLQIFNYASLVGENSNKANILKNVEIKKDGCKKIFEYCSKKSKYHSRAI